VDNLPRVLPTTCDAIIETKSWKVPAIFGHIEQGGGIDASEMFQVFNMGIGMTLVVAGRDVDQMLKLTKGRLIGRVEPGKGKVQLAF
jgi:phosphoribosylformylglycinamidine cyclo-ligase